MNGPGPCETQQSALQYVVVILSALNVALNTWLAQRRMRADEREYRRDGNGHGPGPLDQGSIDRGPKHGDVARKK